MVPVARRNLLAERGRFAMSIGGVAVSVLLVLVVLALYRGFSRTGETFMLLPGGLWIAQAGPTAPPQPLADSGQRAAARRRGLRTLRLRQLSGRPRHLRHRGHRQLRHGHPQPR